MCDLSKDSVSSSEESDERLQNRFARHAVFSTRNRAVSTERIQSPVGTVSLSPRFASNVGWNILGNVGGKALGPLFQLLIARLLIPEDFGLFALALAWLAAFEVLKDWGLGQSIVVARGQRSDINIQFTAQLATAGVFYAMTLALAPLVAGHFARPELTVVMAVVGTVALISAFADPIVTGHLVEQRYAKLAIRQTVTPLASGVVGLTLAYRGYGVYALAVGLVAGHIASTLALWLGSRQELALDLNRNRTRHLMGVGRHVLVQRVFGFLVGHADSLIVGRALGAQALGFYRMGNMLAFLAPGASVFQAEQVVFTDLSAHPQSERIRSRYNSFTMIAGPSLLLYSMAVFALAPVLVPRVLGAQWQQAVPFMQLFAASVVTGFLTVLNLDVAKILGFASTYTRYAAVRSLLTVVVLLLASRYSTLMAVSAWVVTGLISTLVNDALFYWKQDIVRLTLGKVCIVTASWIWAAFVISSVFAGGTN